MTYYTSGSMPRRSFLGRMGAAGAMMAAQRMALAGSDGGGRRPNILLVVTDDQRFDAMGCMGNPVIQTPNMDEWARNGVLFRNNFVTTSICMSSRASIFTGLYTRKHGIDKFTIPLEPSIFEETYPIRLREAGYRTGFAGKWGLGGELPADRFDFFAGYSGQGNYFNEVDGETVHLTKMIGRQAVQFLEGCSDDRPFCLSLSFKAPHVQDSDPRQFLYDPEYEALYQNDTIPFPHTATEQHFRSLPEFLQTSEARRRWEMRFPDLEKFQSSVKGYYRLVTGVDRMLGLIRKTLREKNLEDNTVVVFTSDNGFYLGEYGLAGKWYMHEESIRTPLIVYDPRLPAHLRGSVRNEMTLNIDVAPTLLDIAGAEPHPGAMQGRSLMPLVRGQSPRWRNEFFYEHLFDHNAIPKTEGVRTDRWKYVRYVESDPMTEELFDLIRDPHEEHNLAQSPGHAGILRHMRERHQTWQNRLDEWKPGSEPWRDPR